MFFFFLTAAGGDCPYPQNPCRFSGNKTLLRLLSRSRVPAFVEKKALFLCHVCFGRARQIYLCRTSQQQCSPYLFWRLILGGFVKQTQLAFWSLLFL